MRIPTTVAFICHPISGNVGYNVRRIKQIMRQIYSEEPDVVPVAPYLTMLEILDESNPEQRKIGIESTKLMFRNGAFNHVRLYGDRLSSGMIEEIRMAITLKIPVYAMNPRMLNEISEYTKMPKENFIWKR